MAYSNKRTTEKTFCRICESLCGLNVEVEENEVLSIMPDFDHVATRGFACPKGLKQHKLYSTEDRLQFPLERKEGEWNRTSWKSAISEIGTKVKQIQSMHGKDSVAMYVGTAAGFGALHPIFAQGFMDGLGSNNMFSSASQDCSNKFAVSDLMYGYPFTLTFPDLLHTNCLIIVGANPVVSKWSFLQVPNPSLHLKEMERRGCKIYIVDPRRTETAKIAGKYIAIRPGSDVFFYLSFLNELVDQDGVDVLHIEEHIKNSQTVVELAKKWPSERTSRLTSIPTTTLKEMVLSYRESTGSVMYSSTGVNMGKHGSLSFWIQECINVLSGNLDRKGGALVGKGIIDFPKFGKKNGKLTRLDKTRLHGFHSVNDAFPGGLLADEILTPGNGQIKALFVTGGNPLITMANSNRLRSAFQKLELLVTLDIYPNETGSVGHYMLPCTSSLERPDLPFIFPLMLGLQTKPYLQATRAIIEPKGEQRDESSIYLDLCKASGVSIFESTVTQKLLEFLMWVHSKWKRKITKSLPQEFLLHLLLKLSGQKGFKRLLKFANGFLMPDHVPGSLIPARIYTDDQKIDLAPKRLIDAALDLEKYFEKESKSRSNFKLITKRAVTTHNSWTHNIAEFTQGERHTNYVYMNSSDANSLKVKSKDLVEVSTGSGSIILPVKINDDLQPGTVAVPHGWGHQSSNMKVAKKTKGVNVNILAKDGIESLEKVSGMSQLTGLDVSLRKSDKYDENSWSGRREDIMEVPELEL